MNDKTQSSSVWNWHPELPLKSPPIFVWPPRPIAAIKYLLGRSFLFSQITLYIALSFASWYYLYPDLSHWKEFSFGWIFQVYVVNQAISIIFASGLHLYFHSYKKQGTHHRYDHRELARDNKRFLFNNQVWDNIFWSLVSGTAFWTLWQVAFMWGYANGYLPWNDFETNPVWFVFLFVILTFWNSMYFYFIHRGIHWPPLYKLAHSLHHKNVTIGPWSGLAMHPIEHFIYFGVVVIHLLLASHPIHLFFLMLLNVLGAYSGHAGYEDLVIKGKSRIGIANLFHTLHHKYFECNYGTTYMPCDKWFGTFHDGTEESTERMRERRAKNLLKTAWD